LSLSEILLTDEKTKTPALANLAERMECVWLATAFAVAPGDWQRFPLSPGERAGVRGCGRSLGDTTPSAMSDNPLPAMRRNLSAIVLGITI